jgi:hypothetical protein
MLWYLFRLSQREIFYFFTLQDGHQYQEPINLTVISDTLLTMARDGHAEDVGKEKTKAMYYPMRIHEPVENQFKAFDISR